MNIKVFMGVVGSGKDHHSKLCIEEGAVQIAFADGVREDLWKIIGWDPSNSKEYEEFKLSIFTTYINGVLVQVSGRDLLNNYGTKVRRQEDPKIWLKRLRHSLRTLHAMGVEEVIISDCRFPNEVEFLKSIESSEDDISVEFIFCNFMSEKYNAELDYESEKLAQVLANELCFEDQDETFNKFIKENKMTKWGKEELVLIDK